MGSLEHEESKCEIKCSNLFIVPLTGVLTGRFVGGGVLGGGLGFFGVGFGVNDPYP